MTGASYPPYSAERGWLSEIARRDIAKPILVQPQEPPQEGQRGVLWYAGRDGEVYGYPAEVMANEGVEPDSEIDWHMCTFQTWPQIEVPTATWPPYQWHFIPEET